MNYNLKFNHLSSPNRAALASSFDRDPVNLAKGLRERMSTTCLLSELSSTTICCSSPYHLRTSFSQSRVRVRWPSPRRIRCAPINASSHFQLIPPPYPMSSLEPHMSKEAVEIHWWRHHKEHLDRLNAGIIGNELFEMPLEEIILASYNNGDILPVFIHAAQTWNHDFFWQSMKPGGGGRPSGILLQLIERDFGSFELFLKEFKAAALTQFGSGWVWLTYKANKLDVGNSVNPLPSAKDNKLVVVKTPNAINPLVWDYSPLLTIDVWEHAYYLDYECKRAEYISVFMDKLVSWDAVSSRLELAMLKAEEKARKSSLSNRRD